MVLRIVTYGSQGWVIDESHIRYTFEYNNSHLIQTDQSLRSLPPCHTLDTKNECNFRLRRK